MKNVPELRFPEFEGEWEEKKLGEISEQSMYGIGASATNFDSKNIYIRITDIDEKSRNLNYKNLTTPDEINDKYKLKRNDILFARTGASTGKSYIHKEEKDNYNYYFAGFLIKFEINQLNSPMFIYQFTLTSKFNNWVKVMSVRSGQPGINSEEYAKLPLFLPSKLEQQKIGEFFSKLDRQIELEEQKLELLQQQKKGYMQKIFSQELRFKDENGNDYPEWEKKKLQQIIEVKDGTHESPKPTDNGYLLVTSKNLKNNKLDFSESYSISKEDYESINKRSKVEKGDILFGMIGTIGNPILLEDEGFAIKNVALLKTSCLQEKYYILNFLKSIAIAKQFYKTNAGGTQKFISLGAIRDLKIDFPSLEESTKIGILFNKLDELIKNQ
ncbi:type I restriction modification DNA specificity domain protein [Staphylococcus aureus]|nr:type I restriction modification DNA specificity domain protein [Staphylococcus aureus]SHC41050.1 type I restriction modification DNA specificity domain protein [Staphylococcus aureus]SHC49175.1 type I restriction modification DNA specificity domain protein [Staphylococcus aureus]